MIVVAADVDDLSRGDEDAFMHSCMRMPVGGGRGKRPFPDQTTFKLAFSSGPE